MDWFISIMGILSIWFVGNKWKSGWILKFISQIAWVYLAINKELYGFIPLAVIAGIISVRNYFKWKRETK